MTDPKRTQRRTRLLAAFLGGALALGASALRADSIKLSNGNVLEGVTVVQATVESVSYRNPAGTTQMVDAGLVVELTRASGYLSKVRSALQEGNFSEAKKRADDAVSFGDDWEKAEAAYLIGEIYLAAGKKFAGKAVEAFTSYLDAFKSEKDFFIPHATYGLGRALLAAGRPAEAKKQFAELSSYGGRNGIWSSKAKIGEARAIIGTGENLLEARTLLGEVAGDRDAGPEIQEEALVLRARVFVLQEQFKQATALLEKEFFRGRTAGAYNRYFAQACSVMGDAWKGRGGKANLQEAELWYLKGTLFGKNYPNEYRRAARGLVEVYEGLGHEDRAAAWEARVKS